MNLTYVPLLQIQRDLYDVPPGRTRFDTYIATMTDADGNMKYPFSALNPMAKGHVPALFDAYLAMDGDEIGRQATLTTTQYHKSIKGDFQVCLVVADDLRGGWTNRIVADFAHRFESKPMIRRGWIVGMLWSSEAAAPEQIQRAVGESIGRTIHIIQYGYANTLSEMMAQEGMTQFVAGEQVALDEDELAYSREVIAPYLECEERPTQIACLYGDEAAAELGYEKMGLSQNAGFAVALADYFYSIKEERTMFISQP